MYTKCTVYRTKAKHPFSAGLNIWLYNDYTEKAYKTLHCKNSNKVTPRWRVLYLYRRTRY